MRIHVLSREPVHKKAVPNLIYQIIQSKTSSNAEDTSAN